MQNDNKLPVIPLLIANTALITIAIFKGFTSVIMHVDTRDHHVRNCIK